MLVINSQSQALNDSTFQDTVITIADNDTLSLRAFTVVNLTAADNSTRFQCAIGGVQSDTAVLVVGKQAYGQI